jgi:ABC-type uncharacterized transport system substrate-binding protein
MSLHIRPSIGARASRWPAAVRRGAISAAASLGPLVIGPAVSAHPHVWVAVESTIVYENGAITGLAQRWIFDEFYSASAIQGLDTNNDGNYDRSEMAELTTLNIEGLKEFGYFTYVNLAGQPLEFDAPKDYWMELAAVAEPPGIDAVGPAPPPAAEDQQDQSIWSRIARWWSSLINPESDPGTTAASKVLTLNFTLPLKQPVLSDAEGFEFVVQDPSYYIWFDFAKENPVRLSASAPAGCKAVVAAPQGDTQRLADAFKEFGGSMYGATANKAVTVTCRQS